jgi:hypothetical protein
MTTTFHDDAHISELLSTAGHEIAAVCVVQGEIEALPRFPSNERFPSTLHQHVLAPMTSVVLLESCHH